MEALLTACGLSGLRVERPDATRLAGSGTKTAGINASLAGLARALAADISVRANAARRTLQRRKMSDHRASTKRAQAHRGSAGRVHERASQAFVAKGGAATGRDASSRALIALGLPGSQHELACSAVGAGRSSSGADGSRSAVDAAAAALAAPLASWTLQAGLQPFHVAEAAGSAGQARKPLLARAGAALPEADCGHGARHVAVALDHNDRHIEARARRYATRQLPTHQQAISRDRRKATTNALTGEERSRRA